MGIANTPTANRTSRQIEFVVDRAGSKVTLSAESTQVQLGEKIRVIGESNTSDTVKIFQNSRLVATASGSKPVTINASKLGAGKSRLYARDASGVKSKPLDIVISQ